MKIVSKRTELMFKGRYSCEHGGETEAEQARLPIAEGRSLSFLLLVDFPSLILSSLLVP